jgi:magnesium chelatase family protein
MHGCRCGFHGDATRECRCTGAQIQQYLGKISGPLLDRIDLHVEVPAVPYQELRGNDSGATSAEIRQRVVAARGIQHRRGFYNAHIPVGQLRKLCALDAAGERTLEMAVRRMGLSARAHDRILKVARTIADLAGGSRRGQACGRGDSIPVIGPQLLAVDRRRQLRCREDRLKPVLPKAILLKC